MTETIELNADELDQVAGGFLPQVLFWLGTAQTAEWVAEKAYEAGKWVGENS